MWNGYNLSPAPALICTISRAAEQITVVKQAGPRSPQGLQAAQGSSVGHNIQSKLGLYQGHRTGILESWELDEQRHPLGNQDEEEGRSSLLSTLASASESLSSFGTVTGIRDSWASGYAEPAPAAGYTGETQAPCRPHCNKWTVCGHLQAGGFPGGV